MTAPLVSQEVDLRGFSGFMLDVDRLLASELVALGTPEECWAAVMLWCRAWKQQPAGSLPDDDRILAAFSGTGKRWKDVKAMALRGFIKCDDGRLYHRVLCEEANNAWERRKKFKERSARANERRWSGNPSAIQQGVQQGVQQASDKESLRFPGTGTGTGTGTEEKKGGTADVPPLDLTPPGGGQPPEGRACRIPDGFPTPDAKAWARNERPDLVVDTVAEMFRDHWIAKPGKEGRKLDWLATWRNWVRGQKAMPRATAAAASTTRYD